MNNRIGYLTILILQLFWDSLFGQNISREHELFPFVGFYAPDRFQNSLTLGVRYENHLDRRFAFGATVGFAKAGQDFFQKAVGAAAEQGSATVIFYDGRLTYAMRMNEVIPYGVFGLGVTRQHSESNLTLSLGVGIKFPAGEKSYWRFEINDHIFSSGQGNTSWTNNNLEISGGISFYLQ
ncbi:MAG: outer membrane beta-barrel domain-containing protein [bacterium]